MIIFCKIFCLLSLIGLTNVNCARQKVEILSGRNFGASFKRLQCINSTTVSVDCKLKLIRGKMGQVSIAVTFLTSRTEIMGRAFLERKTSANTYAPTIVDLKFNLCDIVKSNATLAPLNTLMTMFYPPAKEILSPFFHTCPYIGRHEITDVIVDKLTVPNFIQTGDVKITASFTDAQKNALFEITAYVYFKTASLSQVF